MKNIATLAITVITFFVSPGVCGFPIQLELSSTPPYPVLTVGIYEGLESAEIQESDDLKSWRGFMNVYMRVGRSSVVDRSSDQRAKPSHFYRAVGNAPEPSVLLEKWQELNIRDYQFLFTRKCFSCKPLMLTALVTVREGKVVAVENVRDGSGMAFEGADPAEFKSIEEIFNIVSTESERAEVVSLRLDEALRYSLWVYIDYIQLMVDEEVEYRASDLRRLD